MLMTGSRTAVAASGLVGVLVLVRLAVSYPSYSVRVASAAGAALAVGTAFLLVFRTTGGTPSEAVNVRWLFLQTTARMLSEEPAFGVGIGQYSLWSAHFAPPALFQFWRPDNAHNNLAQIAGELGLIGLATFLIVLATPFRMRSNASSAPSLRGPLIAGLAAFILTWLGGHPLLIPEVSSPFWITLGVTAALVVSDSKPNRSAGIVGIAAALLLLSIPFRVGAKSAQLDFSRVSYGVSARQLMTSRSRLFVPASESRVALPLRARGASDGEPVEIDVFVDGSASETITLTDRNWRRTPIDLSRDSSRRFHQIDLRIRPDALDSLDPGRSSVEVGKWEIISKPNG
jgi:O-antigen ligase